MDAKPATNLYTALLAAQRAMGPVRKNAVNPHLKSKYADLSAVLDAIEEPLWENGLLIVQRFQYDRVGRDGSAGEGTPILITELIHAASGEKIESVVTVTAKDATDPQKIGAAITYYRRYSLLALLGLAPEDDDGHAAAQPHQQSSSAPQRRAPQSSGPRAAASPQAAASPHTGTEGLTLAQIATELEPLARQARVNDEALSQAEYARYRELTKALKERQERLLALIRDDEADPQERRKALHNLYAGTRSPAALGRYVEAVKQSGLPAKDLDDAYQFHHKRLSAALAPAGAAG